MRLLRLCALYLERVPKDWRSFEAELGDVTAASIPLGEASQVPGGERILVSASTALEANPGLNSRNCVVVPDNERLKCEAAVEFIANAIAISARSPRSISSASPPVAFVPESADERAFLESCAGIEGELKGEMGIRSDIPATPKLLNGLSDRQDGLALMAEALSHGSAVGRYRDFIRVFENAFSLSVGPLEKKLFQFLDASESDFTRDEVSRWLAARHGASHADLKHTQEIILSADVQPFLKRMEQAALEVLLNKEDWANTSRKRRQLLRLIPGSTDRKGRNHFVAGRENMLLLQVLDPFETYRFDGQIILESPPEEWWRGEFVPPPESDSGGSVKDGEV